jgi:uncharacterized membrane protein (DUF4010 family)
MQLELLVNLAIAFGLGMLIGMERERSANPVAGVRTFTLITMLGVMAGALAGSFGGWILPAAFLGVLALLITGNLILVKLDHGDAGMTTEVAALLMFTVGAALAAGLRLVAAILAGVITLLLHWKIPLHTVVKKLGEADFKAIMRLVLIGLVILPALPDQDFGPYAVLNPFRIWLMVVLIVSISLASYVAWQLFGERKGILLSGVLGGLISSTAATVGYARRTRHSPELADGAVIMIIIASAVVFARVLIEILIVAPSALPSLGPPLATMLAIMAAISYLEWRRRSRSVAPPAEPEPPSDIKAAIGFALLYAAVLFGVAVTREHFGTRALYGVAAMSGLTDMDAITLSTAQLVRAGRIETETGWRLILVGGLANLAFKAGAVAVLGHRHLFRRVSRAFAIAILGGIALILIWPG